ncbi:transcriptional regulator [Kribbella qitaiheensis]|uniref:Transcriptional regulator n=1 Tax=Kribbella qitaiheensis TaxID=1544730 RepID=A0A7G6WZQ5_9ACTN|nr:helix-turn-helix domain-containing protein [Kribbella qitaiheensis]QNE19470.1 transcriptional regulator [Kribbella qitaiheensis]
MDDGDEAGRVLLALAHGQLARDRVASAARLSEPAAGRQLDALIRKSLVAKVPQTRGRPQYGLTQRGLDELDRVTALTDPAECNLLNALSETTPYSVTELAGATGMSASAVYELLLRLMRGGFVAAYGQDERAEYWLTPNGVGRRAMLRGLLTDGPVTIGRTLNAIAAATHQAGVAATRERMAGQPLSDYDRAVCSAELTEQHKLGLFDAKELAKREGLLRVATLHGQLIAVFDGLRPPPLYGEQLPPPRKIRWSGAAFVVRSLVTLPFVIIGLIVLLTASTSDDYIGGAIFFSFSALWIYLAWRSAAGKED